MSKDAEKGALLAHKIRRHEGLEKACHDLFDLVKDASRSYPGKPRTLYVEIEGHRNSLGGFDDAMYVLQREFLLKWLMPYLTTLVMPLLGEVRNRQPQLEDVPDELDIEIVSE